MNILEIYLNFIVKKKKKAILISSAPVMSKAFVLQRVTVCRDKPQPEGHPRGCRHCFLGGTVSFPKGDLQSMGNPRAVHCDHSKTKTENINRKKHRVPRGSGGEISREIRFRFGAITHSIEFNYFIVKIPEDKCPLSLFLHCLSGVITYFQVVLRRHCVVGSVQSIV